jgi:hypothetical protein
LREYSEVIQICPLLFERAIEEREMQPRNLSAILKNKVRYYLEVLNPEPAKSPEPAKPSIGSSIWAKIVDTTVEAATYVSNGLAGEKGRIRAKTYRDTVVNGLLSDDLDLLNNKLLAVVYADLTSNKLDGRLNEGQLFRGCMVAGLLEYLTGEVIQNITNRTVQNNKDKVSEALFAKLGLSNKDRDVRVKALNESLGRVATGGMGIAANFEATMQLNRADVTKNMVLEAYGNRVHLEQENRVYSSMHSL